MSGRDPRDLIKELEREERWARDAESARVTIRLGYNRMAGVVGSDEEPVKPRRSLWVKLGFRNAEKPGGFKAERTLSPAQVDAIYEALAEVRNRHQRNAIEIAKELGTEVRY